MQDAARPNQTEPVSIEEALDSRIARIQFRTEKIVALIRDDKTMEWVRPPREDGGK